MGRQRSVVDPAPHGVVTDPEEFGGLADPDVWHRVSVSTPDMTNNRKCGDISGYQPHMRVLTTPLPDC